MISKNLLNTKKRNALNNNNLKKFEAIEVIQSKLKLYSVTPPNGLIIFYGIVNIRDKLVTVDIDFEPFKAAERTIFSVKNEFNINYLNELIDEENSNNFLLIKLNHEKNVLNHFYRENFSIENQNRLCRGIQSIIKSVQSFMVEQIIVCEDLDLYKVTFKHVMNSSDLKTFYLTLDNFEKTSAHLKVNFIFLIKVK